MNIFWNALKKQLGRLKALWEMIPKKTMRSENQPILHLQHFTKVRLMQLIQGGNRNLRRRDDYSWVCGCSFPRDNNSEVQESLWNWVGFTFEPFSFMHVQIFLIRRCISLHWHLTPAQVPWGDNEGWLTVASSWRGVGCEPSLYCGQPRCRWGAGFDKRHTKISPLSPRLLYLNINPLHSNIPPIS